jgi:SET domain-containing protein
MRLTDHLIVDPECIERKVTSNKDRLEMRRFFSSKGYEYLESNKSSGKVQALTSKLRKLATSSLSASVSMAQLSIAFINPSIGYGCFADQTIRSGDTIGEYTGVLFENNTTRHNSHYAIQILPESVRQHLGQTLYLSAAKAGNELRFVNHLDPKVTTSHPDERITTGPNAKLVRTIINCQPQVHMVAVRDIKPGDEIRISYNWSDAQFPGGKAVDEVYQIS